MEKSEEPLPLEVSLRERWSEGEQDIYDHPLPVTVGPRWMRDNLDGYQGKAQPTINTETPNLPEKDVIKKKKG